MSRIAGETGLIACCVGREGGCNCLLALAAGSGQHQDGVVEVGNQACHIIDQFHANIGLSPRESNKAVFVDGLHLTVAGGGNRGVTLYAAECGKRAEDFAGVNLTDFDAALRGLGVATAQGVDVVGSVAFANNDIARGKLQGHGVGHGGLLPSNELLTLVLSVNHNRGLRRGC